MREELIEENKKLKNMLYTSIELTNMGIEHCERFKNRIEKAVEYIKSFEYYIPEDNKEELLSILQGEDYE